MGFEEIKAARRAEAAFVPVTPPRPHAEDLEALPLAELARLACDSSDAASVHALARVALRNVAEAQRVRVLAERLAEGVAVAMAADALNADSAAALALVRWRRQTAHLENFAASDATIRATLDAVLELPDAPTHARVAAAAANGRWYLVLAHGNGETLSLLLPPAAARARFESLADAWSDVYLAEVLEAPRDVLAIMAAMYTPGDRRRALHLSDARGEAACNG